MGRPISPEPIAIDVALTTDRFTANGRPARVAFETRQRLRAIMAELTHEVIEQIASKAQAHEQSGSHVFLEVAYGEPVDSPEWVLRFPTHNITACYTFYTDEEEGRNKHLLRELRRIQYLQQVVMKQLEMTDRSGSTQVVQGMIASGQKFVAGLTAIFKQVETLAQRIEQGLQNKADMPTVEQKTASIQAMTKALRELPAMDAKQTAIKNMVKQQVEKLQYTITPQTAKILNMKISTADVRPVVHTQAQIKADVKTIPSAKTNMEAKVEVKAVPVAVQAKTEIRTASPAPSETMRHMSATITSIAPNVSAQQTAMRVGNASPAIALQQTLAKTLGITPAVVTPVNAAPTAVAAASVVSAPASVAPVQAARNGVPSAPISFAPISIISNVASVSVTAVSPVQRVAVQNAPLAAQAQAVQAQAVQAPAQQIQAVQIKAMQPQQPHVQQEQQPQQAQQQIIAKQEPVKAVEPAVPPINQPQQPIVTTQPVAQPVAQQVQAVTAQPISGVQHIAPVANTQTSGSATVTQGTVQATVQATTAQPNGNGQPAGNATATVAAAGNAGTSSQLTEQKPAETTTPAQTQTQIKKEFKKEADHVCGPNCPIHGTKAKANVSVETGRHTSVNSFLNPSAKETPASTATTAATTTSTAIAQKTQDAQAKIATTIDHVCGPNCPIHGKPAIIINAGNQAGLGTFLSGGHSANASSHQTAPPRERAVAAARHSLS